MLTVETPNDLLGLVGRELGPSEWLTVDQGMIDKFAEATGDHQWIHVDVERAKREMPGGKTIAHGYLTLSLVPRSAAASTTARTRSASRTRCLRVHACVYASASSRPSPSPATACV